MVVSKLDNLSSPATESTSTSSSIQKMKNFKVSFSTGIAFGFEYIGNCITAIHAHSQASLAKVQKGWYINSINGEKVSANHSEVTLAIMKTSECPMAVFIFSLIPYNEIKKLKIRFSTHVPFGFGYSGRRIIKINPESQAAKKKVQQGWYIDTINGKKQYDNHAEVKKSILKTKEGEVAVIVFSVPAQEGKFFLSRFNLSEKNTHWNINGKNISSNDCIEMCHLLIKNSTVTELNLSFNKINDLNARILAEGLKVNYNLYEIFLNGNQIGDLGANVIAACLKTNSNLKQLSLNENCIGDDGAIAIAECLRFNNTIKEVGLGFNNIGEAGKFALLKVRNNHHSLVSLGMFFMRQNINNSSSVSFYQV